MRKTNHDGHFFIPRSGYDRLIVNLVDNNYGWRDTVIRVTGPWDLQRTVVSFQPHGTEARLARECISRRRGCRVCSRSITIFATGVGCRIRIGPPCPQLFLDPLMSARDDVVSAPTTGKGSDSTSDTSIREAEAWSKGATPEPEAWLKNAWLDQSGQRRGNHMRSFLLNIRPSGE